MTDDKHLAYIRRLPCLVCGNDIETEAAHFSMPWAGLGKPIKGKGSKSRGPNGEECYVVPLCSRHHNRQGEVGEAKFWGDHGYTPADVIAKAMALWIYSGDQEAGELIVRNR